MKKFLSLIAILLLLPTIVFAKDISLKEFNYTDGEYESFSGVSETIDGGYVTVGESGFYPIVVKYDKDDKIDWKKYVKIDGQLMDVDIDELGNIYVVGDMRQDMNISYNHDHGYVAKFDNNGKLLWETHVGDDIVDRIMLTDLEVLNGKIVAVGMNCYGADSAHNENLGATSNSCYNGYYVTLNTDGKILDDNMFGGNNLEIITGVTITKDGGFVIVGGTNSTNIDGFNISEEFPIFTPFIVKYDKNGKGEWVKNLPTDEMIDSGNICDNEMAGFFMDVIQNCDGGYTAVGSIPYLTTVDRDDIILDASWRNIKENLGTASSDLKVDDNKLHYVSTAAIVVEYDKEGNKVNEYIYDGPFNDAYSDILELNSCDYIVTGIDGAEYIRSNQPRLGGNLENLGEAYCVRSSSDASITILDKDLKETWKKTYKGSYEDLLYNISPVSNHEFVAVGYFASDDIEEVELSENYDGLVVRLKLEYEITKNPTEFGSFNAANEHGKADIVSAGDTGIITTTPEEGYKVNSVKVVDSKGEEVPVTKVENGKYTYPIYDDTWVTVTFAKVEVAENPKTGVSTYLSALVFVIIIAGIIYYNTREKSVFKKI